MKPRKPKEERWYKVPLEERSESTEKPPSKYAKKIFAQVDFEVGGNSIEERLARIQFLLSKISKNLSFITVVISVSLIYGFIVAISNGW